MAIQANFPALKPSLMLDFANTKQLDPRITYTRASTATFYNGVTTSMAEQNLLPYSQQFDVADWTKTRATVTANATTAPDGTTTADSLDQLTGQTSYGGAIQSPVMPNATVFFSVYLKANTKTFAILRMAAQNTWFNLSTGAVGTVGSGITASIVSVGSGWYRCIISGNSFGNNQSAIFVADTDGSTTVTDSGGIYLWGAQLEQRSAVSAYTATTTQAITNYIPVLQTAASGVARFDNNPTTGESLGLLIEESRTNLMTYSSQFDNAAWGKSNSTVTANTIVAPDGTLTGDKLVENSTTSSHSIFQGAVISSGASYTISVYAKAAERTQIQFQFYDGTTNKDPIFNLVDGTKVTDGGIGTAWTSTNVGNGWWRFSFTATSAGTLGYIYMYPASGGTTGYTGNGFSGVYIWGAQMEAGAFATSYIPTVASQVTRAADAASMTGTNLTSWFQQQQGSLYIESNSPRSGVRTIFQFGSSVSNRYGFYFLNSFLTYYDGASSTISSITNTSTKIACSLVNNDIAVAFNGNSASAVSGAKALTNVDTFVIGNGVGTTEQICGTIKKIAYYPLRVTNANLQALTS